VFNIRARARRAGRDRFEQAETVLSGEVLTLINAAN
jgi:hypothetical protein